MFVCFAGSTFETLVWGDSESEVETSLTSGLAANHASWWPDTNVETDNVET